MRLKVKPTFRKCFLRLKVTLLGLCLPIILSSQVDTTFWFAAPDFTSGHGQVPVYLRFSTLNQPTDITISVPANPSFVPIALSIGAASSTTVDMSPFLAQIENDQFGVPSDKGILIRSTNWINAYYENASFFNPEIFSLKGSKALGTSFVIPMQDLLPNGNYNPTPYSSFDIVATEDNTVIAIIPEDDIVGHSAGQIFQVVLNKGQTYVCRSTSQNNRNHLGGSIVISDKPIAISIKDDSMAAERVYGRCQDLGGDQITPIDILGNFYITIPGALNNPNDAAFIYGVAPNTQVTINGMPAGTVNRGTLIQSFSNGLPTVIESSKPVYVLHMSGFGCEVGLDQLPPIDPCNGSRILAVNRSSDQPFFLNILVYRDLNDAFLFGGRSDVIESSDFQVVPGTGGNWYYANLPIANATLPVGGSAIIENTKGPFHLSVIHGGPNTGAMYGYFSDYGQTDLLPELEVVCSDGLRLELDSTFASYRWSTGDTTHFIEVDKTGLYSVTVTTTHGCVASDSMVVDVLPESRNIIDDNLCPGDSFWISNEWFHENRLSGEIYLPGGATNGCDSIIEVNLSLQENSIYLLRDTLCQDDWLDIEGQRFDQSRASGTVLSSLGNQYGCDSIIMIELSFRPPVYNALNYTLCEEDTLTIEGQDFHWLHTSDTIISEQQTKYGCDSLIIIEIDFHPPASLAVGDNLCYFDTQYIGGVAFHRNHLSEEIVLEGASVHGCDSVINVQFNLLPESRGQLDLEICSSDTLYFEGRAFHQDNISDTILLASGSRDGCDSIVHIQVKILPESVHEITDTLCPDEKLTIAGNVFDRNNASGAILLKGQNKYGCDSTIVVDLFFPENDLGITPTIELNYGDSVMLEPWYDEIMKAWNWSPDVKISCTDCENPWVSPLEDQRYTLNTIDQYGCRHTTSVLVKVIYIKRIFAPNAITINGDGLNDGFTIFGNFYAERIEELEIYDRWGERVFRVEDIPLNQPKLGWDGTFNNQAMRPGVFVWRAKIRYIDQVVEEIYGDVTIIK